MFNDAELQCPELIREVRNLASRVVPFPRQGHDFLCDLLRDIDDTMFVDAVGNTHEVSLQPFGVTDREIDVGDAERIHERISDWFEYICSPVPKHITPYVLPQAKERFRVLATLLIATFPMECELWPRIIPANDNWIASHVSSQIQSSRDSNPDSDKRY